ncbi:uncharacterized protein HMPREF1541_03018 [Cyphellophora europaea CBS 101466]|uniref:HTH APSES-type domain-containing protein n=1 Tax=Cyphellophora europaea (strain CBS 101466) TaxID=1220924 RepID=W2RZ80_CYPE1|nr:uncharacterized protein HMPREF1541_03018 [Cyphellophora europaea CBS 101466]ETN41083.1 hypothetical protein HMPREF1541_03018 [Cyphellophora europaea CBS 101466]
MSTIKALLNHPGSSPSTTPPPQQHTPPIPRLLSPAPLSTRTYNTTPPPSSLTHAAKPKICKDAPIFTRGPPRGTLRFPPHEYAADILVPNTDKLLKDFHDHFDVYPSGGNMGDYPRHIPYNSEKRVYLDKTARDFFEVFQYQFRVPGDEAGKVYTMLWDYNIGLVRTTPLFKCCGYGKTTPAKMLNKNVGLRDICHSITGGALVAQGYWIPYAAAKAIAATFCYSIRYALTPVFGIDFIDLCVEPMDPRFGCMLIDQAITEQCRAEAARFKELELQFPTARPTSAPGSRSASPRTPTPTLAHRVPTVLRFKPVNAGGVGVGSGTDDDGPDAPSSSSTSDMASESERDISEPDDTYALSPANTLSPSTPVFHNVWTAANAPRSAPRLDEELHSPKSVMKAFKAKRTFAAFEEEQGWSGARPGVSAYSSPAGSPKRGRMGGWGVRGNEGRGVDDGYEAETEGEGDGDAMEIDAGAGPRYHGNGEFGDKEAAKALLSLWGVRKKVGRRASA